MLKPIFKKVQIMPLIVFMKYTHKSSTFSSTYFNHVFFNLQIVLLFLHDMNR